MKDMERQKFEREWRDAFREAEVSPPENLWTNIELDLEKAEGGKMKRRLLYYKLTAAASIAFALCVAGVGTYFYSNQNELKGTLAIDVTRSADAAHPEKIASQSQESKSIVRKENDGETTALENYKKGSSATVQPVEKTRVNVSESPDDDKIISATRSFATNNTLSDTDPGKKKNRLPQRKYKGNNEQHVTKLVASDEQRVASNSERINSTPYNLIKNNIDKETSVVYSTVKRERHVDVKDSKQPTSLPREGSLNNKIVYNDSNSLVSFDKNKLTPLVTPGKAQLHLPQEEEVDPVMVMMAKLQQRELELMNEDVPKKKKETNEKKNTVTHEKTWSTLGIAAGANNSAFNNGKDMDNTYSLGLALGTRVSNRWVVQGGLNYLRQISFSEETSAIRQGDNFRVASASESAVKGKENDGLNSLSNNATGQQLVGTAKYDANKQAQFVSLPLQAGYLALSGKLSLLVNAGVSTDLFLRNTITPAVETGNTVFEKKTENIGGESDYDPVNFNGLFNTELSYKVGKYYRIALNPGLRYPFSSIYKSDTGITAQPLTIDVGMKIRYIFH